jgi:hypothetical protein
MSETEASEKYEDEVFITDLTILQVRHLKDIHIPLSKDERKHLILRTLPLYPLFFSSIFLF